MARAFGVWGSISYPNYSNFAKLSSMYFIKHFTDWRTHFVLKPNIFICIQLLTLMFWWMNKFNIFLLVHQQLRWDYLSLGFAVCSCRTLLIFQDEARHLGCRSCLKISSSTIETELRLFSQIHIHFIDLSHTFRLAFNFIESIKQSMTYESLAIPE